MKTLVKMESPVTQTVEAVQQLIAYFNHGQTPEEMPSFYRLSGELVLVQAKKGDAYYVTTPKSCSCPSATYNPGKPCKHSRKYFPQPQKSRGELEAEGEAATIELFVLADHPAHATILQELVRDGAILQSVDSDTIRAKYKGVTQDKLLSLLEDGWSFEGKETEEDDLGGLVVRLSEKEQSEAIKEATDRFFNRRLPGLEGKYAVVNLSLTRGDATDEEMKVDADRFGLDPAAYPDHWPQLLMDQLEEAFDEELYDAMERAVTKKVMFT